VVIFIPWFFVHPKKTPSTKKQIKHPKFPFHLETPLTFFKGNFQVSLLLLKNKGLKAAKNFQPQLLRPTTSSTKHHLDQRYLNRHQLNLAPE